MANHFFLVSKNVDVNLYAKMMLSIGDAPYRREEAFVSLRTKLGKQ